MVETRVADGLWTAPIPEGGRLLEPGDLERGARRTQAAGDASAYGCVVSTLRADGSGPAYDYDAVYVHLPDRLVREAGGRVAHVTLALRSEHAPAHAATRFEESEGRGGVVRVARCRLPESVEAGSLVKRALQEFRAGSWVQTQGAAANAQATGGAAPAGTAARASASTCAEWVEVWWCTTVTASGSDYEYTRCEFEGYECTRYVSVSEDPWDGGDPPGSGDDPDPCPEGPTDQLCQEGGGTVPTPTDPEPCDTGYVLIDAPGFQAGVKAAWEASNAQAPNPYDRRERGGWIVVNATSGDISIVPITGAVYTPCGIDAPPGTEPPAGAVGLFHTHPYAIGDYEDYEPCRRYNMVQRFPGIRSHIADEMLDHYPLGTFPNIPYSGTPSNADIDTVSLIANKYNAPNFIGIFADKNGIVVYTKESTSDQSRMEHVNVDACGYDPSR